MSIFLGVVPELRAFAEGEMVDTVKIIRKGARTATPLAGSSYGGPTETAAFGRIAPLSKSTVERLSGAELRQDGLEELHVPLGTDVRGVDTVEVTSTRHATVKTYTVEGIAPAGTFDVDRVVLVRPV